jgi:hypothetical protein
MIMTMMHNPASPGELLQEFLGKRTATELAEHIGVARATIRFDGPQHPPRRGTFPLPRLLLEGPAPVRPVDRIAEEAAEDQAAGCLTTCGGANLSAANMTSLFSTLK